MDIKAFIKTLKEVFEKKLSIYKIIHITKDSSVVTSVFPLAYDFVKGPADNGFLRIPKGSLTYFVREKVGTKKRIHRSGQPPRDVAENELIADIQGFTAWIPVKSVIEFIELESDHDAYNTCFEVLVALEKSHEESKENPADSAAESSIVVVP